MLHLQVKGSLCKQVPRKIKKLVAILTTSTSMTDKKTEGELEELERIPCIRYLVTFKDQTEALLDLENKVNAMSQVFT